MNWRTIVLYGATLLAAQVAIGFLEGSLALTGIATLLVSSALSFLACGAIFAHLAIRQRSRPFVHAWAALILQGAAGAAILLALPGQLGTRPSVLVAVEWLVLASALVVGTVLGTRLVPNNSFKGKPLRGSP